MIRPLSELGSANTWLSMLYIGAMLAFTSVGGLLGKRSLYLISINRLIIIPAILIGLFRILNTIDILAPEKLVSSVVILEASMPCMVTVVIMAKEFGADDKQAVGNVFVSTVISILTLPFLVMTIERIL